MNPSSKETIAKLAKDELTLPEIQELLLSESVLVRANAIFAIGRKLYQSPELALNDGLIDQLTKTALDPISLTVEVIFHTKISHLAIACLFKTGNRKAIKTANNILVGLSSFDQLTVQNQLSTWQSLITAARTAPEEDAKIRAKLNQQPLYPTPATGDAKTRPAQKKSRSDELFSAARIAEETWSKLAGDSLSLAEIQEFLFAENVSIRANAIFAIGRRLQNFAGLASDDQLNRLIDNLAKVATDPKNINAAFFGLTTVAHLAIACLLKMDNPKVIRVGHDLLASLSKSDQDIVQVFVEDWDDYIKVKRPIT